jgi:hypothetical protein
LGGFKPAKHWFLRVLNPHKIHTYRNQHTPSACLPRATGSWVVDLTGDPVCFQYIPDLNYKPSRDKPQEAVSVPIQNASYFGEFLWAALRDVRTDPVQWRQNGREKHTNV